MRTSLSIDPAKAALLCIDLQEEHRSDSRYLVEGFDGIIDRVRRIQDAARGAGVAVFHSAYVVDTAKPGRPFHPTMADGASAFSDVNDPLSAICAEVGPAGDEMVLVEPDVGAERVGHGPDEQRGEKDEDDAHRHLHGHQHP